MKKVFLILSVLFIVAFSSCSNDEPDCNGLGYVTLTNNNSSNLTIYLNQETVQINAGQTINDYPVETGYIQVRAGDGTNPIEEVGNFTLSECGTKTVVVQ